MSVPSYLQGLDPQQQKLAMAIDGPIRGVAGAGSGKTTTLTHRIAHMVKIGIPPEDIMVNTFTKKAANEMKERLKKLIKKYDLGFDIKDMTMGTMHSIACRIVKEYGHHIDFPAKFTILDQDDAESILEKIIKRICGKECKVKGSALMGCISYSRNSFQDLRDVLAEKMATFSSMHGAFCTIADAYRETKTKMNVVDFDDLLELWLQILNDSPEARAHMQNRWKYVMVDEYQDTNTLQNSILELICKKHSNIFVVGDDKQSIYAFRAANVNNILEFDKVWAKCNTIHLDTNYRSTPQIVNAADALIRHNPRQLHQHVKTVAKPGEKPILFFPYCDREQNEKIVDYIRFFIGKGVTPDEIMVLYRNNRQPITLEKELARARIPFYKKGARFWQSAHLRLALAWMKMLHNPLDKPALSRIIGIYPGLGDKAIETATEAIQKEEDFEKFINGELKMGKASSWPLVQKNLLDFVTTYREKDETERVREAANFLKGLLSDYISQAYPDNAPDRIEDFDVLADLGGDFKDVEELLDEVALQDERAGEGKKKVLLSTVHGVKGLEAKVVLIMGMNKDVFPGKFCQTAEDLEEERRLCYVAITRAKQVVIMFSPLHIYSHSARELVRAEKSIFLEEIPEELFRM